MDGISVRDRVSELNPYALANFRFGSWLCENVRPIGCDFEASGYGGAVGWILRFCRFDWLTGSCEQDVAVLGGDLAGWAREITPESAYAAAIAWISGRIPMMFMTRVKL